TSVSVLLVTLQFLEESLGSLCLKRLDAYLPIYCRTLQFGFCVLMGTFPFSSFLSGFISCVGSFILEVNLRFKHRELNEFPGYLAGGRLC
uniref:Dolichyl-diphosphooligosaccharide--protein glycosyltransferase subunit DAD1 n=1 Tax=Moschus moschiferus TaxID=68415 RepID=A0A8C6FHZ6_MOSMO